MKTEGEYSMASLKRSEARRQRVLDWLWENGNATFTEMLAGINARELAEGRAEYPMRVMRGTMATMIQKQEVAATGPHKRQVFVALAKVTEPAEAMRERKLEKNRRWCSESKRNKPAKPAAQDEDGRVFGGLVAGGKTVYKAGDNPEIRRGQRGQGAVRQRVTVNCAMPI